MIGSKKQQQANLNKDLLDSILIYIDNIKEDCENGGFARHNVLYSLEDILGGKCAVANIILRILFDLALVSNIDTKQQITGQIHNLNNNNKCLVSIEDKVPLLKAAMHETFRLTCSPIVPHQATQDSDIRGEQIHRS